MLTTDYGELRTTQDGIWVEVRHCCLLCSCLSVVKNLSICLSSILNSWKLIMDASTDVMATVLRCRTSDRTIQGLPAVRAALTVIIPDVDGQDSEPKVHA